MRVLLPTGTIMEVAKVVAVCEQRLTYNGRDLRLCEKASDIAYANGIGLFHEARGSFDVATGNDAIMLGNLSNEVVREVLTSLVIKEWVDLSSLKLQKKQLMTTQYVFDNGVTDPYLLSGFEVNIGCADAMGYPSVSGGCPVWSEAEDTGERESEGEGAGEEDSDE